MENEHHILKLEGHYKNKYNESKAMRLCSSPWDQQPRGFEPEGCSLWLVRDTAASPSRIFSPGGQWEGRKPQEEAISFSGRYFLFINLIKTGRCALILCTSISASPHILEGVLTILAARGRPWRRGDFSRYLSDSWSALYVDPGLGASPSALPLMNAVSCLI